MGVDAINLFTLCLAAVPAKKESIQIIYGALPMFIAQTAESTGFETSYYNGKILKLQWYCT
jgi:hypothetical protein